MHKFVQRQLRYAKSFLIYLFKYDFVLIFFRIKWCGEKVTDAVVGLSRAARLLGHVQYFKHYKNLPPLFRDGPNPG